MTSGIQLKALPKPKLLLIVVGMFLLSSAHAQQVPLPKTAADVPGPAAGTAMTTEYVQMVGSMAYLSGWPLVNSHNRCLEFGKAPELGFCLAP